MSLNNKNIVTRSPFSGSTQLFFKNKKRQSKKVKDGFSWIALFFGGLVSLFRRDFKWFFIYFVGAFALIYLLEAFGLDGKYVGYGLGASFGMVYNSIFINGLRNNPDWEEISESDIK